jgi:hypothetical protein
VKRTAAEQGGGSLSARERQSFAESEPGAEALRGNEQGKYTHHIWRVAYNRCPVARV